MSGREMRRARTQGLRAVHRLLSEEGCDVRLLRTGRPARSLPPVDFLAQKGDRKILAIVLDGLWDEERTRRRIERCMESDETRVYVPWRHRWQVLAALEEWGLLGVGLIPY